MVDGDYLSVYYHGRPLLYYLGGSTKFVVTIAIDAFIVSAMRLTEALRDTLRTSQLESLHLDIQVRIKAMEFNKNALEEELSRKLEAIQRQREELDKKEVEVLCISI